MYRDNKWLRMIHDNWLHHWIDVKTAVTMRSVDAQAADLTPEMLQIQERQLSVEVSREALRLRWEMFLSA